MKLLDLLHRFSQALNDERDAAAGRGLDAPVTATGGRRVATAGTLHLYAFDVPPSCLLAEDVPVTILPPDDIEPTEGFVVGRTDDTALVQAFDAFGQTVEAATIVPDATGFFDTAARRLADMATKAGAYALGPAERLVPWLVPDRTREDQVRAAATTAVFGTIWSDELGARRTRLAGHVIELVRNNKRVLVVSPDHRSSDEVVGLAARAMRAAGLTYKSWLCRYEMPVLAQASGMALAELGFEAQMHQFYAKSRADKAALRRKYDRFRELTPLLAYKAQKQRDLDEVKLLEWRLLTQLSELQGKIKEIAQTLADYESLPIWKRLAMQTMGKNVQTLGEHRAIYEQQIQGLLAELEIAKHRIEELAPEAAIPKDLRPEYTELKQEIKRLGGTKKIREMLAAEEGTNRQAFIQNKRVVVTTAARVVSDPLFSKVRFDVLIADEAPSIPASFLLAAAGLVRERIVLCGDTRDLAAPQAWGSSGVSTLWQRPQPSAQAG
ncbi:MAG: AAA domain-containing protein [Nitrospirota bacterium]